MRFSTILAPIALAASALAQSFSIATPPSLVQCQPVSLSWTGGSAPFTLAVIPGGQTTAAAIAFIASNVNSSPYTWTVNLQTGQSVTLKITDAQGNNAYSSQLTIQQGASSSCLTASSGSSSMSGASASASSSSMMASSTSRSASATSSSMAMSSSAAASSSATASASNSASSVSGQVSSALASVTSTSRSGAFATAVAGLPAVAAGALGAVAVLF